MLETNRRQGENGEKNKKRKEEVLQRSSHRPAAWCMAKTHHSANYDQAFPRRLRSAGNGKSLFSHTPMEAMGHGATQMRRVYKHTHAYTHRNTSTTHTASLTPHAHTGLTPTNTNSRFTRKLLS